MLCGWPSDLECGRCGSPSALGVLGNSRSDADVPCRATAPTVSLPVPSLGHYRMPGSRVSIIDGRGWPADGSQESSFSAALLVTTYLQVNGFRQLPRLSADVGGTRRLRVSACRSCGWGQNEASVRPGTNRYCLRFGARHGSCTDFKMIRQLLGGQTSQRYQGSSGSHPSSRCLRRGEHIILTGRDQDQPEGHVDEFIREWPSDTCGRCPRYAGCGRAF